MIIIPILIHIYFFLGIQIIKELELNKHRKKTANFNEEQVEIISSKIIQKITNHFVNHLKEGDSMDESIEWIEKVFQLEQEKNPF